jgi:hypothetical protein
MPESPNLAIRPEPIVTREAPVSHISAAEAGQPYQMLANSLDKLGQGLEDMAVPLAEKAGYKAVTRDADGNIQVEQMPMFGRAGVAYQHAVKMAALAEGEGAAKRADIAMRSDYRDNPQGYQVAAQAFKEQTVKQYADAAGPEVGRAMGQAIDNTTTLTYRGLIAEKERLDLQRSENALKAGMESAHDDALALSRWGAAYGDGPDGKPTPLQLVYDQYHTIQDNLAANPRLAYTPEQKALDREKFDGDLGGQRLLYHVNETYKDKGRDAALDVAKDVLTNPDYKLKPAQREAYYHKAVGEIRTNEAIRTQDYQLAMESFRSMQADAREGQKIEPARIDAQVKAFRAIGGVKGANGESSLRSWLAHADLHDDFQRQPIREQTAQTDAMSGASRQRTAYEFFRQKAAAGGATPQQASLVAAGLVGGFRGETGNLNTMQIHDQGIGFGIAGWNKERLAAFTQFAKEHNMSLASLNTQLEFAWHELNTTERASLTQLMGARTPEEAGAATLGYFRPANYDVPGAHPERARYARAAFDIFAGGGDLKPGSPLYGAGPGIQSFMMAQRQSQLRTSARQTWDQVMKDWDNGKGALPSNETLSSVIEAGQTSNNVDLLARVARDTQLMDYADRIKQLPLDQQSALQSELERRIQAGETRGADVPAALTEPGAELVLKELKARTEAIRSGLQKEPWQTVVNLNPNHFKTPAPINWNDPQQAAAGLAMRSQIVQAGAQQLGTPPLSALGDADVERVKQALATPDLAARAQVWGTLATLPDDVRGPTFQKIAGNDPNALAEASAGDMMRENPAMAKSIMAGLELMKSNHNGILKAFEPKGGGAEGFDVEFSSMLPATAFGSEGRTNPTGNYATIARMVQARYAYLAINDPKAGTTFSAERLQTAVNDVTGGIVEHNGKTIVPTRGMTQSQFDQILWGINDQDLAGVHDIAGQPLTEALFRREARLEAIGNGRYLVNLSKGDPPSYAMTGVGTEPGGPPRFVLDLTRRQPAQYGPPASPWMAVTP